MNVSLILCMFSVVVILVCVSLSVSVLLGLYVSVSVGSLVVLSGRGSLVCVFAFDFGS